MLGVDPIVHARPLKITLTHAEVVRFGIFPVDVHHPCDHADVNINTLPLFAKAFCQSSRNEFGTKMLFDDSDIAVRNQC